ncbi:unnamed protein product [Calicophoron daubneyi]|uniref:C2H2-type domain-containing protein n=1 Tax=Calicophoron daubneyi TaxID=300641 RepID=A0AAV2TLV3_CALDB
MSNPPSEKTDDVRLICHRCSKSFKSVITLKHHIQVCSHQNSEPRFPCEICHKRFRTDIQYSRHVYYTHSQRGFMCTEPDCGRSFVSKSHLVLHLATHTTNRPFACSVPGCSYRARTAGRLAQHKAIHGQGRRFSCDYCDYSATTSSNLRRHARIHAGARPYLCPHCSHRTSELDALKKHVLDSGRHPGLPLYVCPWCTPADTGQDRGTDSKVSCVGFNASGLAWRHLIMEHANEFLKSSVYKRLGRSSGKGLLERDVTRLLGIYCPEVDSTQPPENVAVRQPAVVSSHRRRKDLSQPLSGKPAPVSDPSGTDTTPLFTRLPVANDVDHKNSTNPVHTADQLSKNAGHANSATPHEIVLGSDIFQEHRSHKGCNETIPATVAAPETNDSPLISPSAYSSHDVDHSKYSYNLVQIGSGALWCNEALNCKLSGPSVTGSGSVSNP